MARTDRILVVDDDDDGRDALTALLEAHGYGVMSARDGSEALRTTERDSPSLVISDVVMPQVDGFELVRKLRARASSADVPVILLTGHDETTRRVEGLDLGADDFLAKPVAPAELLARVRVHLRHAERRRELERRVHVDPLTEVLNRRGVMATLNRELERSRRDGTPMSVLMLDVDRFKQLNDNHGHAAGDAVLRTIARRLTEAVRAVDLVGRLGGDEFVVVVPGGDETAAAALAERIALMRMGPVETDGRVIDVGVSAGAATLQAGETIDDLLDRADRAMYRRKRFARGTGKLAG
ncbi:MAG TPA: diguanylate cyclase [Kofleriaceae bacterium]|nr:diguanylate cyclase [Kofleriaceae bacterium]